MLDAYIVDRIRREREADQGKGSFIPLYIEVPRERVPMSHEECEREEAEERGSAVIDFNL